MYGCRTDDDNNTSVSDLVCPLIPSSCLLVQISVVVFVQSCLKQDWCEVRIGSGICNIHALKSYESK